METTRTNQNEIVTIRRILEEGQPWYPLPRNQEQLAEIMFSPSELPEATDLSRDFEAHGVRTEILHRTALAMTGRDLLVLSLNHTEAILAGMLILEKTAATTAWIVERLRSIKERRVDVHPTILLQVQIHAWLDKRYGTDLWTYDPDGLEIATLGAITVFRLVEERTGNEHVLALRGFDENIAEISFCRRTPETLTE